MTSGADAWLVDDRWGKAYPLTEQETTIGRGQPSSVIVRDPAVSRVHASVRRRGLEFILTVSGASGASINGQPVTGEHKLAEGDTIEIALTALRFTFSAPTGEMFIVSRDHPVQPEFEEAPTRATLHGMHPITLASRSYTRLRGYWHFVLIFFLTIAVLSICAQR
jgi:pSer/pThr/pTyr-binding forkhead associated (FHA) protein